MRELPKISDAEWQVMKVLWKESPLNASQVINELQNYTTWSPKTIHTLLGRLADKGALNVDKSTTPYAYYPRVSQEECIREETKFFLEKIFDGSIKKLLVSFVDSEELSREEIEELRRILD
ncbi:MAG TPA: BlaI/MecI/CopY family transcriptional regulator [Clostridiales bacterium]|jgi:BlaI family penicillinase repressor|nr:BlaI/MecI/CopY family transcriptional regulator [Clostridiales bacterium]